MRGDIEEIARSGVRFAANNANMLLLLLLLLLLDPILLLSSLYSNRASPRHLHDKERMIPLKDSSVSRSQEQTDTLIHRAIIRLAVTNDGCVPTCTRRHRPNTSNTAAQT